MSRFGRTFKRITLGLMLAFAGAMQPLHAQLDPKLQASTTDFLELYQASTNVQAKPEILTIFDFSGSMSALMFHPLFVNNNVTDGEDAAATSFTLNTSNVYQITASVTRGTRSRTSTMNVTVDGTAGTATTGSYGSGSSAFSIKINSPGSHVFTGGTSYTFTATTTGTSLSPVTWSATGGAINPITGAWTAPSAGAAVIVKLTGSTVGTLASTTLVKPNGSIVTASDAAAASTTSGLPGAAAGAADVRNWIRAASHVRFQYLDGTVVRTVDYPIPWKVTNRDSTGNPLSSQTVKDEVVKGANTYGTGHEIEIDKSYASSFDNNATTVTLSSVWNKWRYIDWLFIGKYTEGPYTGKYIVFDAADATLAGGQGNVNWGQGYGPSTSAWGTTISVPQYNLDGSYKAEVQTDASANVLPALTRTQATKRAAIQTWIKYQKDVYWAFRFLDVSGEAGSGGATTINNNSSTVSGSSGWKLLNSSSETYMNYIAARGSSGSTPLTYAMARGLAQFTDPNCVFNSIETGAADSPNQCMNHFLILFTDGLDNNGTGTNNMNGTTPYLVVVDGKTTIDAAAGNKAILATPTLIDRSGANWNLFTFAAVGAHMADPSLGTVNVDYKPATVPAAGVTSGTPSSFLPFAIKKRSSTLFSSDHRITTMTVGVSLGGKYTDASSPKRSLFLGAALGEPILTKVNDLSVITPFEWVPDPTDPGSFPDIGKKKANSIFFFDATNPDALTESLGYAIKSAIGASNINATSNPNLPFVGASFGKQLYVGKFQPPKYGGAIWPGDLLMFGTREVAGQTKIIDKNANIATALDSSTALWSASESLVNASLWSARKLYTRLPNTHTSTLKPFTDIGDDYTDTTTGLTNFVGSSASPVLTDTEKKQVIQKAAGGDTSKALDADGRPTVNRTNIMGDIINSAPATLEYKFSEVEASLPSRLAAVGGDRFRLILVGTNQGWLHAFGEVTKTSTVEDSDGVEQKLVTGAVEELWSFMPTDFLAGLDQVFGGGTKVNNSHRFMVDGSPLLYHLDLPPSGGGSGNGVVDSTERAVAVIGLRKGGRSYYALDIHNPFKPSMKWVLAPDEAASFPSSQIITGGPAIAVVKSVLAKWGYSSCTPAIGRVQFNGVLHDAVFLGGGFSTPEVDAQYSTVLGRSVMAVDVYSGQVLAAKDLTDTKVGGTSVGPVGAGLIPFEFVLNSGMAQRSYFLDYKGGLWAWGSSDVSATTAYKDFRIDTSEITDWSVRKVYQDDNDATSGYGGRYTTVPAPFRVGLFPGVGKSGTASPSAVGIAMVSGDRNNPLDYLYNTTTNLAPDHHRLTVVFDRQDSRAWGLDKAPGSGPDPGITDAKLLKLPSTPVTTTPTDRCTDDVFQYITPNCSSYYLAPTTGSPAVADEANTKFGYYINFDSISNAHLPKGISPPSVVAGSLYYSVFHPKDADPCTGGAGETNTWLVCDVLNPIKEDNRSGLTCLSGLKDTWAGLASDFIAVGTRGVIQGGAAAVNNPQSGSSLTTPEIHTTLGTSSQRYPKTRVWRTVH